MGQQYLLASMMDDQDFPGKVIHRRHVFFFISIAEWSFEEDDTIVGKVAKGNIRRQKWKNRGAR